MLRWLLAATLLIVACGPENPLPGYKPASGDERAAVVRAVEGYYALRTRAIETGDLQPLFAAYPKIASGEDRAKGINSARFYVFDLMRGLGHTQLSLKLEAYEPIRVWVKGSAAVAYVHGIESFPNRTGPDSSGEFYTRFELVRDANDWSIERTDE